ncbi:MAG: Acyl-[acyl-carrier-protein]--UDP-N-acetylglucosamine O-acyltransferase [Acidobacteria bacterium]|nr:Acyl-[acyl-carrier-protein]--UDP-N-acetylglucosamine O-acyltransferase [Acidobacteriota bacterium]
MTIHSTATVHPTAIIGSQAAIGPQVQVGPYAVIEDEVVIGAGCIIGAHAVIKRFTSLGARNRVFEHTVLGGEPQDVKFKGQTSSLIIGDDNLIREFCTLHRANGEGEITRIGSRNFLMVGVHIAHNCTICDDNIFANDVALAGHIIIEDRVFLSNNVGAHQFVRFGRCAMIGGKSKIVQDVLPFFITDGNPARVRGVNSVGLRRAGFSTETRQALKEAYRLLFRSDLSLETALNHLEQIPDDNVTHLVNFIRESKRGFTRSARRKDGGLEAETLAFEK